MDTGYRACNKCGEVKKLTEEFWHKSAHTLTGFYGTCKKCRKEIEKPLVMSDAGIKLEFEKKYGVIPTIKQFEAYKKWRKANRWAGVEYRG